MAVSKVIYGTNTLIDLTTDSVEAAKLMKGCTAHDKAGEIVNGTLETISYYSGTSDPDSSLGSDGDLYFKL